MRYCFKFNRRKGCEEVKKALFMMCLLCVVPVAWGQKTRSQSSPVPEEEKLRTRLEFFPHDADAHKSLIEVLRKKYAFRAVVIEDSAWIKNNPNDCDFELIELVSYSTEALHDPEFAIAKLRSYLASVARENDSQSFDSTKDRLAALLVERGRPEDAVPLLADLVRLDPEEAGLWVDYGGALAALDRSAEAVQAMRHSVSLDPSAEYAHERLGDVLLKSSDLKGAETEYRATVSVYEDQYKHGNQLTHFTHLCEAWSRHKPVDTKRTCSHKCA